MVVRAGDFGGLGLRLKGSDTLYSCLPLYHNNALTVAIGSVINSGATLALGKSFSASRFWDEVIVSQATAFIYIGEICRYLLNQPAKPTRPRTQGAADRRQRVASGDLGRVHLAVRHRAGLRVLRGQRRKHRLHQRLQRAQVGRLGGAATGLRRIRFRHRRAAARSGWLGAAGARRRARPVAQPGQQAATVRRLHRSSASEKKLVRDAFRKGDCWFNTGDVMSPQGMGHAAFVDRLGDTFRWKGENVATTQVERALAADKSIEECTVFGVEVPRTGGRAGMAAVKLRDGAEFDGKALAHTVYDQLPAYALPLFVRVVDSMEHTTTFKSRKVDLREQAYGPGIEDPLYVLAGRDEGYVPFYDEYPDEVAAGKRPQG